MIITLFCLIQPPIFAGEAVKGNSLNSSYFCIKVVDDQTDRGVPLVELKTTNQIAFYTDSQGIAAIDEPGLMNQKVFFSISSHGYEYPKDGFGYNGKAFDLIPGQSVTIPIKRINIAERLYRITGQGIYRDSLLAGLPVPIAQPALNGQVIGQDSIQTCWYQQKMYWFWGDTGRPSYPLGHFAMAGATIDLPGQGGLDPSVGINLNYYTDKDGFSRKMAPMSEPGLVWLDGLFTVKDNDGKERMLAKYARLKDMSETKERGLMCYNDDKQLFEPLVGSEPEFLLFHDPGHPIKVLRGGQDEYYYFPSPFPLSVRMRVRAKWDDAINPDRYEVLTAVNSPSQTNADSPSYRWIASSKLLEMGKWDKKKLIEALEKERRTTANLYDIDSAKAVIPHGGSIYWNNYLHKWIMITVQTGGKTSFLGEVWYAQSDTPTGPWCYAKKIATHNKYSFYNPKQHPYFDQENSRKIYFEGTYTVTFSGQSETATPRYDYNQMMYRLDLADPRLQMPEPVYEILTREGKRTWIIGKQIHSIPNGSKIIGVPFYALSSGQPGNNLIAVYTRQTQGGNSVFSANKPDNAAQPLFYAMPASTPDLEKNPVLVGLYAVTNPTTGEIAYTIDHLTDAAQIGNNDPVFWIWTNFQPVLLFDADANPYPQ